MEKHVVVRGVYNGKNITRVMVKNKDKMTLAQGIRELIIDEHHNDAPKRMGEGDDSLFSVNAAKMEFDPRHEALAMEF